MRKFEGRSVKRSELFHTSRFTLQTSRSSGGRTRTFTRLLNREPPYHWATPDCCFIKSGWLDLNQRSRVSGTRGVLDPVFNELGHILICKAPSENRTRIFCMASRWVTTTPWAQNCITTKLSKIKIKSTEPESNPHHLVTTEESCR